MAYAHQGGGGQADQRSPSRAAPDPGNAETEPDRRRKQGDVGEDRVLVLDLVADIAAVATLRPAASVGDSAVRARAGRELRGREARLRALAGDGRKREQEGKGGECKERRG